MATRVWQGDAAAVAQSGSVDITTGHASGVYTLTVHDEAGNTAVVNDTSTSATDTVIAAQLATDWNNSGSAVAQRVTAVVDSTDTSKIILTADTAGVPFTIVSSVAGGGAFGSYTAILANSGPNDWNTAENWSGGAVPVDNDHVIIPAGKPSILYGLGQSTVELDSFKVLEGYSNTIGGTDSAYLRFTLGSNNPFEYQSTGKGWIDLGASADSQPIIFDTASPTTGLYGLSLKGTAMTYVNVVGGNVGIGTEGDDTTTEASNISTYSSTANVTIGASVTDVDGNPIDSLTMHGGTVTSLGADIAAVTINSGTLNLKETVNVAGAFTMHKGTVNHEGAGTIAALTMNGGTYDTTKTPIAKTLTTVKINAGTLKIDHDKVTLTNWSDADDKASITVKKI